MVIICSSGCFYQQINNFKISHDRGGYWGPEMEGPLLCYYSRKDQIILTGIILFKA